MKTIMHITDESLGLSEVDLSECVAGTREAARAIVLNQNGEIALIFTAKHGHHKLPGGGIEQEEDFKAAAKREALEEIGYEVNVRQCEVGKIVEQRGEFTQISYCGIADVVKDLGVCDLTESEIEDGFSAPKWVSLEEALRLFSSDKPQTYLGKFMHARDMKFVETALELLKTK